MKRSSLVACAYFALLTIFACFVSEASSAPWINDDSVLVLGKCKVVNSMRGRISAVPRAQDALQRLRLTIQRIADVTARIAALEDRKAKGEANLDNQILGQNNILKQVKDANPTLLKNKLNAELSLIFAKKFASYDGLLGDLGSNEAWTLHGLWPSNADGKTPVIADTTAIAPAVVVPPTLATHWKDCSGIKGDAAFQNYEWEKHGRNGPAIPGGPDGNGGIDTIYKGTQAKALYQKHALDLLPAASAACDSAVQNGGTFKTAAGAVIASIRESTSECVVNVVWNDPAWAVVA